jgi:AI-2 transport protein TqsA
MNLNIEKIPFYIKFSVFFTGVIAFGYFLYIGQDIIIPLLFSALIAILLDPLVTFFQRIRIPRLAAITLSIVLGFLIISGLI